MKKYLVWKKNEAIIECQPAIASSPPPAIFHSTTHHSQPSPFQLRGSPPSSAAAPFCDTHADLVFGQSLLLDPKDAAARLFSSLASRTLEAAGGGQPTSDQSAVVATLANSANDQQLCGLTSVGMQATMAPTTAARQPKPLDSFLSAALAAVASAGAPQNNGGTAGAIGSAHSVQHSLDPALGAFAIQQPAAVDSSNQKTNNSPTPDPRTVNSSTVVAGVGQPATPSAASTATTASLLYSSPSCSSLSSSLSLPGPGMASSSTVTQPGASQQQSGQTAPPQQQSPNNSASSSSLICTANNLAAMAAAVAAQSAITNNAAAAAAAAASILSASQHRLDRSPSSLALLQNSPSCTQQLLAASGLLQNPVSPANTQQQNPSANPASSFLSSQTHSSAFQVVSTLPKPIGIAPSPGQSNTAGLQSTTAQLFPHYSALDAISSSHQQQPPRPHPNQQSQQGMSSAAASSSLSSLYPGLGCLPNLLENIGQQVLRSNTSSQIPKPIPNNERVDLLGFRLKDPQEWMSDDVVTWMLDVARRHGIECENLNMHKFAKYNGPLLMLMNEQGFKECDPCYGSLLYAEFRKLVSDETSVIDDWLRNCKTGGSSGSEDSPRSGRVGLAAAASLSNSLSMANTILSQHQQQAAQQAKPDTSGSLLAQCPPSMQQSAQQSAQQQPPNPTINGLLAAAVAVAASSHRPMGLQTDMSQQLGHQQQLFQQHQSMSSALQNMVPGGNHGQPNPLLVAQQRLLHPGGFQPQPGPSGDRHNFDCKASSSGGVDAQQQGQYGVAGTSAGLRLKVRKNKDGRPRKRSQHTKGNKLWEFIRDALKDSSTCPSVVRWEDPIEGVFRIVESEKLARLWGEKKNNQKMTYEKLSRAMRTYYEKQILVPVPKTGLYPKKLVYKFGPCAHGWSAPPHLVLASNAHMMEQH